MKGERMHRRVMITLLILANAPVVVYANMAAGFLFSSLLHIILLNPILGVIETAFVQKVFRIPVRYGMIILGNYVSSIVGLIIFSIGGMGLDGVWTRVVLLVLLFVGSVLVEWPFFRWALKAEDRQQRPVTLLNTTAAQAASYLLLLPLYLLTYHSSWSSGATMMEFDMHNLAGYAHAYRSRPQENEGGGGNYTGFHMARALGLKSSGKVSADSVTFFLSAVRPDRRIAAAIVDSSGRIVARKYWLDAGEDSLQEVAEDWLGLLAREAHTYRMRQAGIAGKGATYTGYRVPSSIVAWTDGTFYVDVFADSVIFTGIPYDDDDVRVIGVVDSSGKVRMRE